MSENKGEEPSAAIKLFGKTIQLPTTDAEAETHETATATVLTSDHNDDDHVSLCNSEELHLQRNSSFDHMLTSTTTSLSLLDASTNNKDAIRVIKSISDADNHQAIINPTVAVETEINKSTSTTSTALPPPPLPPLHHNIIQNQSHHHHHPIQGGSTSVVHDIQINNTATDITEPSSTNYKQLEEDQGHREITSCSTPPNHKNQLLLIGGGGGGEVEASASATGSSSVNENLEKKKVEKPQKILPCPRCNSMDTKFCYFNNYNVNQPRHFCKSCQRYWTSGGSMRNVPIGAGRRKNKNMITMNMTTSTTACSNFHLLPHLIFIPKTAASMNISSTTTTAASRTSSSNGFIYPSTPNPINPIPNPANYNLMMGSNGGVSTAGALLAFASSSDPPPRVPHPHLPPLKVCDESMVSYLNLADNQSMMMITDKEDKKRLREEEVAATCFHVGVGLGGFSPSLSSSSSSSSLSSSVVVPQKVLVPCNFPASLSPAEAAAPAQPPWNSSWGPPFQLQHQHPWSNYSPNNFLPIANPVIGVPPPRPYNNNNNYWGCNWSTSSPSSVWLTTTHHHHKQQLISNPPGHDQYHYHYSASSSTTSSCPNSSTSLGKHSRNGIILHSKHVVVDVQDDIDHEATDIDHHKRSSSSSDHNHKVLVPKTLRVNDPNEAQEKISSIWATLGITTTTNSTTTTSTTNANNNNLKQLMGGDDDQDHHTDLIFNNNIVNNQVSLFKGFEESSSSSSKERKMFNGTKGSLSDGRHSLLLQANPAALSRSLKFRESAD